MLLCVREAQAVWGVLFRERGRGRRRGLRQCTLHPGARQRRPRTDGRPRGNGSPELWGIERPLILTGAGVTPHRGNDIHDTALTSVRYCHTMSRLTYAARVTSRPGQGVHCKEAPPRQVSYLCGGAEVIVYIIHGSNNFFFFFKDDLIYLLVLMLDLVILAMQWS